MNTTTVELIYLRDCPNVALARERLLRAFAKAGKTARWREWASDDPASPDYARACGSPTILVGGRDVGGIAPAADGEGACRIYGNAATALDGAPSVDAIADHLRQAGASAPGANGRRGSFAAVPAIAAAALPKLTCPACWPAYSGVLSALGVSFVNYTPYLLPLTAAFLLLSLAALAWRARERRGYGPLILGFVASVVLLVGKFAYDSDGAMYAGIALLVVASLLNAWPSSRPAAGNCPACDSITPKA